MIGNTTNLQHHPPIFDDLKEWLDGASQKSTGHHADSSKKKKNKSKKTKKSKKSKGTKGGGKEVIQECSKKMSPSEYALPTEGPFSRISTPPGPHLAGFIAGLEAWIVGLKNYETPISIRFENMIDMVDWNCAAMYSPTWKDALTKSDTLVRAPPSIQLENASGERTLIDLHVSDTRLMCIGSAWGTVVQEWVPEASQAMFGYLEAFQYPEAIRSRTNAGYDSDVAACFDGSGEPDSVCLKALAEESCYNPFIMGRIAGQQITEFGRRDGWNMYGDLNSDGSTNSFNGRRFTDPTKYQPSYNPSDAELKTRWSPLLEDNGAGYFTRQEHVVPHIGSLAKPRLLSREEIDSRTVPAPEYNYTSEAMLVASRMANLSDEKKMLIEFFDDKIAVVFALASAIVMKGASFEHILNFLLGFTAASYDSIILAWKEKISHDLVRPTTWIQDQMADVEFETWVRGQGVQTIKGKEFESFIRVMPHAEHVSGSGCIFQSMYELVDSWLANNLGITNSMSVTLGLFPAGSSKTEPGITPAVDMTLTVSNLLELCDLGGQSRLDGGMHFTDSIEAAHGLCEGVGHAAAQYTFDIW